MSVNLPTDVEAIVNSHVSSGDFASASEVVSAAVRLLDRLKDACGETLARAPGLGTRCDELLPGMRCYSVGNYVIFFTDRNPVEILRVVNGKRDLSRLKFSE